MGEELFWALRGGGANNFGVVLSYKIRLVYVPPQVTTFGISRTLNEDATKLVEMWQTITPQLVDDLWFRAMLLAADVEATGNRTIQAIFQGMFLGRRQELLPVMEKSFPELGLKVNDFKEMSWVQPTISFAGYDIEDPSILLSRKPEYKLFQGQIRFCEGADL
ncbi:berberine bridge enzyme-like 26 [Canna indica]|uniref:Berberine bridge enzyme-like 26 n=1 Tax=Canna indica TaxID=4628 RepID=A0AAQ3K2J1_9LILI|nr:berberine bridge enzyme-like 26 [Canna indica]